MREAAFVERPSRAARRGAMEAGQYAAAVAAVREGVLSGKRVERSERGQPGEFEFLEKMSPEELEAYARGELVMPDEQERLH